MCMILHYVEAIGPGVCPVRLVRLHDYFNTNKGIKYLKIQPFGLVKKYSVKCNIIHAFKDILCINTLLCDQHPFLWGLSESTASLEYNEMWKESSR